MLLIKCATCKRKLWKYEKFGRGEVLRCYKSRIDREFEFIQEGNKILCLCGKEIGIDKGKHIKKIKKTSSILGKSKNNGL